MLFEASSLASAALLSTIGWLPTGLRWNTGQFPIPYCISTNATRTSASQTAQRNAVLQGINAWIAQGAGGSLSCTTYTGTPATYQCSALVSGNDARFNIFWESSWTNGSNTLGVTWSTGSGSFCGNVNDDTGQGHSLGCKFDSDIELNDATTTWTTSGSGGTDIASIMAHEYGHFIGLDHCNDNGTCNIGSAVMFASYPGGTLRVPFADDVQGACALYPGTPGGLGWPCTGGGACSSGTCVTTGADGYCTLPCGSCPQGYACEANPQNPAQNVCVRDDGLNKDLCEICQLGVPNACAANGICIRGLPENSSGRCVTPCGGGCQQNYQCLAVQFQDGGTGNYCFPRSNDCNDPSNFTVLQLGQQCNGNPPCDDGLTCVGICSPSCTPGGNDCPQGFGCESFQNGEGFCLPSVSEGQGCEGLTSCGTGPCLINPNTQIATCYQDCAGNPGICNNAQDCNTYNLQGGGSVSICEPPGVPPLPPDGGVIDPVPDSGTTPPADGGVGPDPDGGVPAGDAGGGNNNNNNNNNNSQTCACDLTYSCDPALDGTGQCICDPECTCDCDQTFACDPGCEVCDPECQDTGGGFLGCSSTRAAGQDPRGALTIGLLGLLWAVRPRTRRLGP